MTYYTSATASNPRPVPKLHLFWVCEPKKKGSNIRAWGISKEEAFNKLKTRKTQMQIEKRKTKKTPQQGSKNHEKS